MYLWCVRDLGMKKKSRVGSFLYYFLFLTNITIQTIVPGIQNNDNNHRIRFINVLITSISDHPAIHALVHPSPTTANNRNIILTINHITPIIGRFNARTHRRKLLFFLVVLAIIFYKRIKIHNIVILFFWCLFFYFSIT